MYFIPAAFAAFLTFPYGKKICIACGAALAVVAIVLTVFSLTVSTEDPENAPLDGLTYSLSEDEKSYSVSFSDGSESQVEILDYYLGKPVTSISDSVFSENAILTSVSIPSTVTHI